MALAWEQHLRPLLALALAYAHSQLPPGIQRAEGVTGEMDFIRDRLFHQHFPKDKKP